jgi:hypothetical protein
MSLDALGHLSVMPDGKGGGMKLAVKRLNFYQSRAGHIWINVDHGLSFQLTLEQCQHVLYELGSFWIDDDEYNQADFDRAYGVIAREV